MIQEYAPDYRVLAAADGRAALEILKDTPVALVLLDLMMPEMDGFTLLKLLRDNNGLNHDVPVIVLTAQILNEAEMSRLNDGVAKVLGKGMFTIPENGMSGAALARNQKQAAKHMAWCARRWHHPRITWTPSRAWILPVTPTSTKII